MGSTTGKRFVLLLVLSFLESGTTMLIERAVHFLSHDHLGFSDAMNLWLAVAYGLTYTAAALLSHRACKRIGERRLLICVLIAQALVYSVPLLIFNGPALLAVMIASGAAGGEHEGLIGAGFFVGPLAGLAGTQLGGKVGSASLGAGIGAAPIIVTCTAIAVRALVRRSAPPSRP